MKVMSKGNKYTNGMASWGNVWVKREPEERGRRFADRIFWKRPGVHAGNPHSIPLTLALSPCVFAEVSKLTSANTPGDWTTFALLHRILNRSGTTEEDHRTIRAPSSTSRVPSELRYEMRQRRGVVLFVVTVVIALASLAAYSFLLTMQGENKASRAAADQLQVAQVAASGEEFMAAWLQTSRAERHELQTLYGDTFFSQTVSEPTVSTESISAGTFQIVVPVNPNDQVGLGEATVDLNGQARAQTSSLSINAGLPFRYGVLNESAKLHLRTLLAWDELWPGAGRNALLQLPSMTNSIADAILDWIDQDDVPREFGGENEFYGSLSPPVIPRNGIPTSMEELLQVRGVTPRSLFGVTIAKPVHDEASGAMNIATNSSSQPSSALFGAMSAEASRPWIDFLTVYSAERNAAFDGTPRVYLNNPDLAELHGQLLVHFSPEVADFVVLYRQYGPAETADGNAKAKQTTNREIDLSLPATHQVAAVAELIDAVIEQPGDESSDSGGEDRDDDKSKPLCIASPFSTRGRLNPELDAWLDRLTIQRRPSILGRLNILAADPIVVAGLPYSDPSVATRMLGTRETLTWDQASVPGTSWILADGLLDRENYLKLSEFLTAGGDVVRFQLVATHPSSSLVNRFEVILDGTVEHTQRIYFRDLRRESTPGMFDMFYQPPSTHPPTTSPGLVQVR